MKVVVHAQVACTTTFESSLNELNMTIQNSISGYSPHTCARSLIPTTGLVLRPLYETLPHGKCGFLNILCFDPQICWTK